MNELQHGGAFVIQFRAGVDFGEGQVVGRIEHIASGCCGQGSRVRRAPMSVPRVPACRADRGCCVLASVSHRLM